MRHVAGLEPLLLAGCGSELICPVCPALVIPDQSLIGGGNALGLEDHRMTGRIRRLPVRKWKPASRIAIYAIGSNFRHEPGSGFPMREARVSRSVVPSHGREEDLDVALVKLLDHVAQCINAARKIACKIPLVAVVDTNVGVDGPKQHTVDATVSLLEIV